MFAVRTFQELAAGAVLLSGKPVVVATWAVRINRSIIRKKITIGIPRAAPKFSRRLPFPATALANIAYRTFRTFNSRRHGARVFTFGIPVATDKLSEAAGANE